MISKVSDLTRIQDIFSHIYFIFQHSFPVALHMSPSDVPISVIRLNTTWCFSLQREGDSIHLTKIAVIREQFLVQRTKVNRLELDLVSKLEMAINSNIICEFSPCQPLSVSAVRYALSETGISFSENVADYPQVLLSASQVMMRNMLM